MAHWTRLALHFVQAITSTSSFTKLSFGVFQSICITVIQPVEHFYKVCGYRVRNLKFATYLKFATCENTNKINELW